MKVITSQTKTVKLHKFLRDSFMSKAELARQCDIHESHVHHAVRLEKDGRDIRVAFSKGMPRAIAEYRAPWRIIGEGNQGPKAGA